MHVEPLSRDRTFHEGCPSLDIDRPLKRSIGAMAAPDSIDDLTHALTLHLYGLSSGGEG